MTRNHVLYAPSRCLFPIASGRPVDTEFSDASDLSDLDEAVFEGLEWDSERGDFKGPMRELVTAEDEGQSASPDCMAVVATTSYAEAKPEKEMLTPQRKSSSIIIKSPAALCQASPRPRKSTLPAVITINPSSDSNLIISKIELPSEYSSSKFLPNLTTTQSSTEAPESPAKPKRPPTKSPYFLPPTTPKRGKTPAKVSPNKRSPGGLISCIPFPPLHVPHFGLIQERLAHDPYRLLIAVTFLNRTKGKDAIPVFYALMSAYPTPELLAAAPREDIVDIIRHLGLQNQRAATYQTYARLWIEDPPAMGRRYAVPGYPEKADGRDIKSGEILDDTDPRTAWELGHMTKGAYALDSWRIFCRDECRGLASSWNGEPVTSSSSETAGPKQQEAAEEKVFQPEWMRVLPTDKELRAYLRWMWLKEGFEWDPFTGEKEVAGEELMRAALEGRIAWDEKGGMRILDGEFDPDAGEVAFSAQEEGAEL